MIDLVVRRPHPLVRRDRHDQPPAALEARRDRGERGMVVGDMLDDVERSDEVIILLGNAAELGQRRAHHRPAQPLFRDGPRRLVQL